LNHYIEDGLYKWFNQGISKGLLIRMKKVKYKLGFQKKTLKIQKYCREKPLSN